jgi:hypothetical protein
LADNLHPVTRQTPSNHTLDAENSPRRTQSSLLRGRQRGSFRGHPQKDCPYRELLAELKKFLEPINAEAYRSLLEAGDDLLALHRLNVPNTLHRSLLSTNAIENSFLNTRRKLGRVTRFRADTVEP